MSHAPVDLVILALGCNDLKKRFSISAFDIAEGAARTMVALRGRSFPGVRGCRSARHG